MSRKKKNGNGNGRTGGNSSQNKKEVIGGKIKAITFKKKLQIVAKTQNQKKLLKSIKDNVVTIVFGPPGSGKTRLAVLQGLRDFKSGKYDKLLFTRPCIEANGENLGFLPGDLNDKIHPYMIPIFDFLLEYMESKDVFRHMGEGTIVTLPLAFMRGVTFSNSYVLLDESQNTNKDQVRMFLTRIGDNCKVVTTGDVKQTDIKGTNGLVDSVMRLKGVKGIGIVEFTKEDVQRHPIVVDIEEKYE